MKKSKIYLDDYSPPDFIVDSVELGFALGEKDTRVDAKLALRRNGDHLSPLVLNGEDLKLETLQLAGRDIAEDAYTIDGSTLTLNTDLDEFMLETGVRIRPQYNTSLSGLYCSSGNFCTQCEAEGFRRITYFPDRPDVLTRYKTTITADKAKYPVLLSNGNLVSGRDLGNGTHQAEWDDPFPKPSYLFALVAGDLAHIEDQFTTKSGRSVALFIYTQHHNIDKCSHAMASLKQAMRWDETVYGREYDLDQYMIVAVDDFNMGAMENKGLNIFNSKYVLARPETATDSDYQSIEGVVAHEYFHNWSGNRVTCRDWFQLSLKEGFTVFRDQEFSADMGSRGVKRIQDANVIRVHQFMEDAGPLAHAVRPQSYQEINNFYTVTVYNKGAEVVRMLHQLVGADGFRRGTDHYFETYDGQAVTTDDFIAAIEDQNGIDLVQFKRWYDQAGTPVLNIEQHHDPAAQTLTLDVSQSCPATPGQKSKLPLHMPLAIALLNEGGEYLALDTAGATQAVLEVKQPKQKFIFHNVPARPVLSALRGFSAPVKVEIDYTEDDLFFLMVHDTDPFARWEATQRLSTSLILGLVRAYQCGAPLQIGDRYTGAFVSLLRSSEPDCALLAQLLRLPSEAYVSEFLDVIDPEAVHHSWAYVMAALGRASWDSLHAVYDRYRDDPYEIDAQSMGRRRLKNTCLHYLLSTNTSTARAMAVKQFDTAANMTDMMAALSALNDSPGTEREQAMAAFYKKWKDDNLVVDKWLSLQATSRLPETLDRASELISHEAFSLRNPNNVYALLVSFSQANPIRFHDRSGRGYRFISDHVIKLDKLNPQVAARLATAFNNWRRYDDERRKLMSDELHRILQQVELSNDVEEIVSKALAQPGEG